MTRRPIRRPAQSRRIGPAPTATAPDPELSRHAHALLDQILEMYPTATALLIAVDAGGHVNATSIPHAWSTKRGIIDILYEAIHGEDT